MADAVIAEVGRRLARALARAAYERDPDSGKAVRSLQSELCAAVREESASTQSAESAQSS
jgi:hypothetical protein